jgi:Flp pilus assembly protein TadG
MRSRGCNRPCVALGRRGATSLEFALVGSLLLTLLLGVSEAGRYMMTLQSLRSAADEAVRLVVLRGGSNMNAGNPACTGMSGALSGAASRVAFLDATSLTVNLSACSTNSNGMTTVTVTISYPFTFQVTYFGTMSRILIETAPAVFR